MSEGKYPEIFKVARITPIHKCGSKTDHRNYRPISNLPTLNKIFEKLIHKRLYSFFTEQKILSESQFGFMKKKSTSQANLTVVKNTIPTFSQKKYTIAIFIDNSKAFDTVPHNLLVDKCYRYGARGVVSSFIKSYLENRKHYTEVNKTDSDQLTSNVGVPQGSCDAPLYYIIFCNDLIKLIEDMGGKVIMYAGDTVMLITGVDLLQLEQLANHILSVTFDWCNYNKLIINKTKTKYLIFSNREAIDINLKIGNDQIEKVDSFKYLGITLDTHLKYNAHVANLTMNMSQLSGITYRLGRNFDLYSAKQFYYSFIFSKLSYGITVWGKGGG